MNTSSDAKKWGDRLVLALIIVLAVIIIFIFTKNVLIPLKDKFTLAKTVSVKSSIDGAKYAVHDDYPDSKDAANMLARINQRVIEIIRHLKQKYVKYATPTLIAEYPERVKAVNRLLARYNPDNLAENSPFDPEGDSAYSLDKGALIALCLRDRKPRSTQKDKMSAVEIEEGRLHSIDTITFVMIHEMAHVAVDDIDHPPRFWAAFKFLLKEAEESGVIKSPNYRDYPVTYCGILVDYNPLYDERQYTL
jgi:hypothetical protein